MAAIRGWHIRDDEAAGAASLVTFLEIDLARTPSGSGVDIDYVPFGSLNSSRAILDQAAILSQMGPQAPRHRSILLMRKGEPNEHVDGRYPGRPRPTYRGATIVSANSAESALLMRSVQDEGLRMTSRGPVWPDPGAAPGGRAVIEELFRAGRLTYMPAQRTDLRVKNPRSSDIETLMPFSPAIGYLSGETPARGAAAGFNGGYYLNWDTEFDDPYSFAKDHVGLVIAGGKVVNAPLFKRSALLFSSRHRLLPEDDARYSIRAPRLLIKSASLENYAIRLPHDLIVRGEAFREERIPAIFGRRAGSVLAAWLNPTEPRPNEAVFYNRLIGLKTGEVTITQTPAAKDRIELVIAGEEVCAIQEGGETYIPRNGFVVSLPASRLAERIVTAVVEDRRHVIEQGVDLGDDALGAESGLQVGPQLIRRGLPVDVAAGLDRGDEEYVITEETRDELGIPPVNLSRETVLTARYPRLAVGIRPDHHCYVVLTEGTESRSAVPDIDSAGGTLADMVRHLLSVGCTDAIGLDGGGSAQIVFGERTATRVAERFDIPFMPVERLLPGGWLLRERD